MDTILCLGSNIALITGIVELIVQYSVEYLVSGALILGFSRIGKILERKAKAGLELSFEGNE
jgi:cation transport ATPase